MSTFKTDALRPSSLPSAQFGQASSSRTDTTGSSLQEDLQKSYEEWNKRIDMEVGGLASGLQELIDLANIGESPSPHAHSTTSLNLQLRTSQIIRSTQNLRDIAHDLKLTLLLSDEMALTQRRDHEIRAVRAEIEERRKKVGEAVVAILEGEDQGLRAPHENEESTSTDNVAVEDVDSTPRDVEAEQQRQQQQQQEKSSPEVEMRPAEVSAAATTEDSDDDEDMEEV